MADVWSFEERMKLEYLPHGAPDCRPLRAFAFTQVMSPPKTRCAHGARLTEFSEKDKSSATKVSKSGHAVRCNTVENGRMGRTSMDNGSTKDACAHNLKISRHSEVTGDVEYTTMFSRHTIPTAH